MYKKRVITLICALGVATAGFSLMGVVSKADTDLTDLTEPELSETEVVAEETCETEEIIETSVCEESEPIVETEFIEETVISEQTDETEVLEETEVAQETDDIGLVEFEEYLGRINADNWRITVYTYDDLTWVPATDFGYYDGVYVFEADTPMKRDEVLSAVGNYAYEIADAANPFAYIDRMTPEEAGVFYRDFFDIRGISTEQILNCDESVFDSVMAEWDYAGERAGLDANDLV